MQGIFSLQSSSKTILLFPLGGVEILTVSVLKQRRKRSLGSCLGNASVSLTWNALLSEAPPGLLWVGSPLKFSLLSPAVMTDLPGSQAKGRGPAQWPPNDVWGAQTFLGNQERVSPSKLCSVYRKVEGWGGRTGQRWQVKGLDLKMDSFQRCSSGPFWSDVWNLYRGRIVSAVFTHRLVHIPDTN